MMIIGKMKPFTIVFILAELGDILTTFYGLSIMGVRELNTLFCFDRILLLKIAVIFIIVYNFEMRNGWKKFVWVVPIVASLPAIWNTFVIVVHKFNL